MPLDPALAARLHLLEDLTFDDVLHPSPAAQRRIDRFNAPFAPYTTPDVDVRNHSAPGPHGDVPIRVYRPSALAALDKAVKSGAPATTGSRGAHPSGGDRVIEHRDVRGAARRDPRRPA